MWEDESGWNAYNDSVNSGGGGFGGWDAPVDYSQNDWMNDQSMWSDNPQSVSTPDWNRGWSQTPPSSGGAYGTGSPSWQQDYDFTPKYTPGAVWNPSVTQMSSGMQTGEQMAERLGTHQAAQYYRGLAGTGNPLFRDAEHILGMQEMLKNPMMQGPLQRVTLAAAPAVYSGAKYLAQSLPPWLRAYAPSYLTQASPPSWNEVWSGTKAALR